MQCGGLTGWLLGAVGYERYRNVCCKHTTLSTPVAVAVVASAAAAGAWCL